MFKREVRKGFTLIELIVVMVIIGILVLLATPKFMGYTQKAKLTQIMHDVKVVESVTESYLASNNDKLPPNGIIIAIDDIKVEVINNKVFDYKGKVTNEGSIIGSNFEVLDKDFIKKESKSRLPGQFIANDDGKVYYIHDKPVGGTEVKTESNYTDQPIIKNNEIDDLIALGFIPVASADELQRINGTSKDVNGNPIFDAAIWGEGTPWEKQYTGNLSSKYIQVKDINLSSYTNWIPVGIHPGLPFKGEYNGGNFTISNLTITSAENAASLFGSLGGAIVKISNLKLDTINIGENAGSISAALVGNAGYSNINSLFIENIKVTNANISASDNTVGGLLGDVRAGNELGINNVLFEGNLTGKNIGSIIAYSASNMSNIRNITIKGNLSDANGYATGAMVGQSYSNIGVIENISYEGNITGKHIGGLIGHASGGKLGSIKNISIKGEISSLTDGFDGGLFGEIYTDIDSIENVLIASNITGRSSGGLAGFSGSGNKLASIKAISITGNITGLGDYSYAGGLFGQLYVNVDSIEDISIASNLTGAQAGGLIGGTSGKTIVNINNIDIKGNIKGGTNGFGGGIIGGCYSSINTIQNILVESIIDGETVGGLFGEATSPVASVYNITINNSKLTGDSYAGGLVGGFYGNTSINKVLIKNTTITSNNDYAGGIAAEIINVIANDITIQNSKIKGALSTGGIAGAVRVSSAFSNISIDGNTTINGSSVVDEGNGIIDEGTGGLAGNTTSVATMSNINISANITGIDNVGEIYGYVQKYGVIDAYSYNGTLLSTGINKGGAYGFMTAPE